MWHVRGVAWRAAPLYVSIMIGYHFPFLSPPFPPPFPLLLLSFPIPFTLLPFILISRLSIYYRNVVWCHFPCLGCHAWCSRILLLPPRSFACVPHRWWWFSVGCCGLVFVSELLFLVSMPSFHVAGISVMLLVSKSLDFWRHSPRRGAVAWGAYFVFKRAPTAWAHVRSDNTFCFSRCGYVSRFTITLGRFGGEGIFYN